jgi:hypothetical protein
MQAGLSSPRLYMESAIRRAPLLADGKHSSTCGHLRRVRVCTREEDQSGDSLRDWINPDQISDLP